MFACEDRASIVWARDSVRGMASRLTAVTPADASVCISAGSSSGDSSPTTAWPLRRRAASSADGFWTRRTTSLEAYRSAVLTTVAPASVYAWSGIMRAGSGAGLDEDLQPGSRQLAERFGHQGDTALTLRRLPGDADLHGHHHPLGTCRGRAE